MTDAASTAHQKDFVIFEWRRQKAHFLGFH